MLNLKGIMKNYHSGCYVWLESAIWHSEHFCFCSCLSHFSWRLHIFSPALRCLSPPLYLLSFKQWLNFTFHEEKRKLQVRAFLPTTHYGQKWHSSRPWITFYMKGTSPCYYLLSRIFNLFLLRAQHLYLAHICFCSRQNNVPAKYSHPHHEPCEYISLHGHWDSS